MKGLLKDGEFVKGWHETIQVPGNAWVEIVDAENHPIYGKRYKVKGYNEWFEENCFEYVQNNLSSGIER